MSVRDSIFDPRLARQFAGYVFVGGVSAIANLLLFVMFRKVASTWLAAPAAFVIAGALNYGLCVSLLFRHRARWSASGELVAYGGVVAVAGGVDLLATVALIGAGVQPAVGKAIASAIAFILNFIGRRLLVFPERRDARSAPRECPPKNYATSHEIIP